MKAEAWSLLFAVLMALELVWAITMSIPTLFAAAAFTAVAAIRFAVEAAVISGHRERR